MGLALLFGLLSISLTGCLRVHAALAVSQDDLVSGEIIVAGFQAEDGPTLDVPSELADKVQVDPYVQDGYVGKKITLSGLRFADLTVLVDSISSVQQYRLSLRRAGDLVTLAGSIDLTRVPADRADVQVKIAFPGQITRTNGDNADGTISWSPKPGAVTEFSTVAEYSNSAGFSWTDWVAIVGGGAVVVALLVVLLALFTHRRTLRLERAQAR